MTMLDQTVPAQDAAREIPAVTLRVCGAYDFGTSSRLREQLDEAIAMRPYDLVVDLSECDLIDATTITVLLSAHRTAARQGVRLVLTSPSAKVERTLALCGLRGVFTIVRDEVGA